MIITKEKSLEEIWEFVAPYSSVLVVGCDSCTQPPRGLREAETYASLIEMMGSIKGKEIKCGAITVVRQCCNEGLPNWIKTDGYEAMLSMACGVGVQILTEVFPEIPTFPAQNTMFIGSEEKREGNMYEKCLACGDCMLGETGGVCPRALCAKGLMNGPCGGCIDGKCEVPDQIKNWKGEVIEEVKHDCGWYLIFERLRDLKRLDLFEKYRETSDFRIAISPRRL